MAAQVKQDLILSGFVPKNEKSIWQPIRQIIFLGYVIDTDLEILSIPEKRLSKLSATIDDIGLLITQNYRIHVKKIASLVGQIISMSYVIGNVAHIMTKYLSIDILSADTWSSFITLSDDSIEQISFWKNNLSDINVRMFTTDVSCNTIVYSDASSTGYGGYIVENPDSIAHGMWSDSEKLLSSTWKELTAVKKVLFSLSDYVNGKRIKWFTDNQNVVNIISKGSMKCHLQDIALDIYKQCLNYNLSLDVEWIPRTKNERADFISRIVDFDYWGISEDLFLYVDSLWGPHEIDWFANDDNHKLPVFYSRYWNVKSIGIDAFTVDWGGINGLLVPPVCLLFKVLQYMKQCRAYGTVVLPMWKSASFWPMLCPAGDGFIKEVVGVSDLPTNKHNYIPGKGK
jgi:hypothetical protein